jgi:hypothetical protein
MRSLPTTLAVLSLLGLTAAANADSIQGSYVEARIVPRTSPGENEPREAQTTRAVLAWQIRQGTYDGEKLDGQTVIAVVTAEPSPGAAFGQTKTVFYIDTRATEPQQRALVHFAKVMAPQAIHDAGQVVKSKIDVRIAEGCGCGAAVVECELAKFRTRPPKDADVLAPDAGQTKKPLGDVFTSTEVITTEFLCGGDASALAASQIIAFAGSFSR